MRIVLWLVVLLICGGPTLANAVSFSYHVDQVTVGSEVFDFDGTSLPPTPDAWGWAISFGTASVADGTLTLSDPGTLTPITVNATAVLERSDVVLWFGEDAPILHQDHTSTSIWEAAVPPLDDWFGYWATTGVLLSGDNGYWDRLVGLFVANFSADVAAASGALEGLQVLQLSATWLDVATSRWAFDVQAYPILASDISDQIIFEINYDADYLGALDLGRYDTRISIDGGQSYYTFDPVVETNGVVRGYTVAADPIVDVVPEPTTILLLAAGLAVLAAAARQRSLR